MRIAIIIPSLKKTAPIELTLLIVNSLMEKNWDVVVFHFGDTHELTFPCSVVKLPYLKYYTFSDFDIIHSHLFKSDLYSAVYLKLFVKKNRPIFISTLHNDIKSVMTSYYGKFSSFYLSKIWYWAIMQLDLIICLSNTQSEFLKKRNKIINTKVINNGSKINIDYTNHQIDFLHSLRSKYKVIGMVVNLYKLKGIEQVISSLVYLDDFVLVIVGSGPEKNNLLNFAFKCGVGDRCFFLGHVDNGHTFNQYFDIFVMSSYSEGFGISVLEAAQYKKAVVCSNLNLYHELFTNDEVVFFELGNIKSLVTSILMAYNRKLILGELIYMKYKKKYTIEHMTSNYINLYSKLLSNNL